MILLFPYLHNLINQFFSLLILFFLVLFSTLLSTTYTHTTEMEIRTATQPSDKQQPSAIDENCATGSNNTHQQTGNGDIPHHHAPPLQVSEKES